MISILILLFSAAIFLCVCDIRAKMKAALQTIAVIYESLEQIADHSNEKETNTIRAINEMCNALNQSFTTTGAIYEPHNIFVADYRRVHDTVC